MQQNEKILIFNKEVGKLIKNIRKQNTNCSLNQFAREFDFDRGNFSKLERGLINLKFITLWKFSEAVNIKLSDIIKILENNLGSDFKLIDE